MRDRMQAGTRMVWLLVLLMLAHHLTMSMVPSAHAADSARVATIGPALTPPADACCPTCQSSCPLIQGVIPHRTPLGYPWTSPVVWPHSAHDHVEALLVSRSHAGPQVPLTAQARSALLGVFRL